MYEKVDFNTHYQGMMELFNIFLHKVAKNNTLRKKAQNYVQNYVHNLKNIGLPI